MFSGEQLKKTDIETLKRWVRNRLGGYQVMIADIKTNNLLFRGVPWPERPTKVSQLSYPPPEKTPLGRANRPGQPMFYCSVAPTAPFPELRAKPGELIALSEWKIKEGLWMHNLGYHQVALQKLGTRNLTVRQRLSFPIAGETKQNAKMRADLSLAFTKDVCEGQEYYYKLSVVINELLYEKAGPIPKFPGGPKADCAAATVYPSMQLRGDADNVVIWPEFVDSSLEIKSVRYILVEATDQTKPWYTMRTVAYADTFSGGDIIWRDEPLPERKNRTHFYLENDTWYLRDDFGNLIDAH